MQMITARSKCKHQYCYVKYKICIKKKKKTNLSQGSQNAVKCINNFEGQNLAGNKSLKPND